MIRSTCALRRSISSLIAARSLSSPRRCIPVADHFHVLKNLMETFQAQIGKENKAIREALILQTASLEDAGPVTQARRFQRRSQESRLARWQKAHELCSIRGTPRRRSPG